MSSDSGSLDAKTTFKQYSSSAVDVTNVLSKSEFRSGNGVLLLIVACTVRAASTKAALFSNIALAITHAHARSLLPNAQRQLFENCMSRKVLMIVSTAEQK
ncbi:dolichyl-diphosphooligosaccharide--protein glyco syltransferase subunit stt3, partial [Novosphingobium sp. PY1]